MPGPDRVVKIPKGSATAGGGRRNCWKGLTAATFASARASVQGAGCVRSLILAQWARSHSAPPVISCLGSDAKAAVALQHAAIALVLGRDDSRPAVREQAGGLVPTWSTI